MLIFQASQADNSQRFREVKKGRHFNVVYQNAPFILMTWVFFVVSQKKERVFSKNLFVWLNRDLAVNPGGDIRIVISPGWPLPAIQTRQSPLNR